MKAFLKKSALCSASCLQAVAIVGVGAIGAAAISTPVYAQDYTSGALSGVVTDESGNPVSGATVTVTSSEQGFTRTATTSATGSFRFTGLQTGSYDVVVNADGQDTFTATGVSVLASQTAQLTIGLTTTGNEIVVTGAQIVNDFAGTTTGLNVDIAELVKTVPVNRDLTSVVLLAPGTSRGDTIFGNLASIGGSSVAENAYYINGLNVTNFDNYLGSAEVPFDMLRTVEVKSGGYQAEFGRATGGIVNQTTKSGSNDFFAAAHIYWEPEFLTSHGDELETCDYDVAPTPGNPTPSITCTNITRRNLDETENRSLVLEAGGPIIKDRLFVYGLVEFRKETSRTVNATAGTAFDRNSDDPFWGFKVDAYPIDGHHLEFTMFDTESTLTRSDVAYSEPGGEPSFGLADSVTEFRTGGLSYVGKYTGNFTDWFTLSAAYGVMKDRFDNVGVAGAAGAPYFINASGTTVNGVPNNGFFNGQRLTSTNFPYRTEREFWRADADLFFTLFGDHHVRFGFDVEKNSLVEASVRNGGDFLVSNGFLTPEAYNLGSGGAGAALLLRPGNQVEINYFNSGGSFDAKNTAYYIQDEWNLTDRLTLNIGLRRDDFSVDRPDGQNIVTLDKNYAPRLGATYELFDDHSGKIYASYGEYFLPFASNTAFRTTGQEYYVRQRYEVAGFDSNGLPILGPLVTSNPSYQGACPFQLVVGGSMANCNVTGDGSIASSDILISQSLKATKENEWIVGYEQNFSDVPVFGDLKLGLNYTRRRLLTTAEDAAIDLAVLQYCDAEGITGCSSTWTGFHQYVIINPGQGAAVVLDGLDGRTVEFTAEQLGYPKAVRKYDAVEFTFERPWDGVWNMGGSYTWSKSRGNSEGFVQSDFGQDDAGITQDFDQPGFTDGAYGNLPNDRRHRIKLWGAVQPLEGLTLGTNVSIQSPRSLSCIGHNPNPNPFTPDVPYSDFGNAYGSASHYCNGTLSPRGEAQKSAWISTVDLKAAFEVKIPMGQLVRFRADVFNVFNAQGIQERNEIGELESFSPDVNGDPDFYYANPNYGVVTSYQTPRYVRLGVDIEF